ncbi:MarR family transcriptional regulator [Nonomuraea dietziae]|uniref:MarR family transcriptional regulator n=1 Tax=Nonomuraea dietziae TaxID=65515 RepID=UPI0033C6E391
MGQGDQGYGLEPGEFDILSTLRRSGESYELAARTFLKASLVTTGAVALRVDRMADKGLVTRRKCLLYENDPGPAELNVGTANAGPKRPAARR